jgi:hypothetical protein
MGRLFGREGEAFSNSDDGPRNRSFESDDRPVLTETTRRPARKSIFVDAIAGEDIKLVN